VAERYLAELRAVQPHGPYRLGGYSFGGNVAFEMALRLRAAGETVANLVLIDALPPETYHGVRVSEDGFCAVAPELLRTAIGDDAVSHAGPPPRSLDEVVEMLRQPTWTDRTAAEYRRFLSVWLANFEALTAHRPDATYDGPAVLLSATDPRPLVFDLLDLPAVPPDGWRRHLTGPFRIVPVPGDHYTMFRNRQHLERLVAAYDREIAGTEA